MPKGIINRPIFYSKITPLFPHITTSQKQGLDAIIDVWEDNFSVQTPITQFSYELGTTHHETGMTMQPVKEKGGPAYYKKMYDIKGSRPGLAKTLGNIYPGDGAKFPGMGYVQNTGRGNAKKATKRLRELSLIDSTVDFEKNPELQMVPRYAAAIMFIGMEEGWFTGRKLDQLIDEHLNGDEHSDFVKARSIINGKDRAEAIAHYSDLYLIALAAATKIEHITKQDLDIIKNKKIVIDDVEDVKYIEQPGKSVNYDEKSLSKYEIIGVQKRLRELGYNSVGKVDGIWGVNVKGALIKLQHTAGITEDGKYGPETRAALADNANKHIISNARKNTTMDDLRAQGSKTIKYADSSKTTSITASVGLGLMGASSAIVENAPQALAWLGPVKEFFGDMPIWIYAILGIMFCIVIYKNSARIANARLADEQSGAHTGLADPAPSPPVEELDSDPDKPTAMPKFLLKEDQIKQQVEGSNK